MSTATRISRHQDHRFERRLETTRETGVPTGLCSNLTSKEIIEIAQRITDWEGNNRVQLTDKLIIWKALNNNGVSYIVTNTALRVLADSSQIS